MVLLTGLDDEARSMEHIMKRTIILAAFAVFATGANAQSLRLSAAEAEVCRLLELAHESSCAEYAQTLTARYAAAEAAAADEATGSIERPVAQSLAR